jgi:hypothetical protein
MTDLVACLSTGKGTWGNIKRIIEEGKWDNVFLISNDFGKENFKLEKKCEIFVIDSRKSMNELVDEIKNSLKEKINGTEVALNLISGSGKEHMALMSAIMKMGLGFRLFALTTDGIKEL